MTKTRHRCIALDHDDTSVHSTPEIHYPAFVDTLSVLRPGTVYAFEDFQNDCFDPGFDALCRKILGFTDEEMQFELDNWKAHVSRTVPSPCDGISELIRRQHEASGYVCVVTHNCRDMILRDWSINFGSTPDEVYDWDLGDGKRKPAPFPIFDMAERFSIPTSEILVVDDLKPGYDMARAAGARFAAAGWAEPNEKIKNFMKQYCDEYFDSVAELCHYLFD